MKSSVEALEGNQVKLYVEVEEAEFDADIDKAFKLIAREVRLPGFRPGKAPRKVLEAQVGIGPAREQALRDGVPEYLAKAVREHDVDLIATPQVEITDGQESGPVEFEATCTVRPIVEVPGHDSLTIELPVLDVTDEELDEARTAELRKSGSLVDAERPAEAGDFVTLDLAATRDGEEVIGLNTEDWNYEVGQGWISDDFDDQLTGASVGDELSFTSTPKGTEEPADFTVKVTAVQKMDLPELTDDWVADNTGEFDTIDDWSASLRDRISEQKLSGMRRTLVTKITTALTDLAEIEAPEAMVSADLNQRVQTTMQQFQAQGIDFGQWMQMTGQDPEQFVESMRGQSEQAVRVDLALRAVAAAQSLDVEGNELEGEYARMAMQYGQKAKDIRRAYEQNDAVPELVAQIKKNKALDWLVHNVDFVDENGAALGRDLVLGHTHDEAGNHIHDHDHDHDDHDHDTEATESEDAADATSEEAAES